VDRTSQHDLGTAPATTAPRSPAATGSPSDTSSPGRLTYVLDTSVLLSDPRALLRFAEHDVVLPVVVVTELEAKRHHAELGYFARGALRLLDDLRVEHGRGGAPRPGPPRGGPPAGAAPPPAAPPTAGSTRPCRSPTWAARCASS
jgi:PhoH-like ATPase